MIRDEYYRQILKLLPTGDLWEDLPLFKSLFMPFAIGLEYIEIRLKKLIEESRAQTALETLEDKEKDWGLPDNCTGQLPTIYERQVALWQKMVDVGGQRRSDYIEIAARMGYLITIEEMQPFTTESTTESVCNSSGCWRTWIVNILNAQNQAYYRQELTTESTTEDRVNKSSSFNLECVFNKLKPAHSNIIFNFNLQE